MLRCQGRSLKVVHILSTDLWGGAGAQVVALASALNALENLQVVVVTLNRGSITASMR
jgi:hypothetical protein